jgi:hypothetical protein
VSERIPGHSSFYDRFFQKKVKQADSSSKLEKSAFIVFVWHSALGKMLIKLVGETN